MRRPRVGSVYTFRRAGFDRMWSHADVTDGRRVRVVRLPGCPRPGTLGQWHVADAESGALLGMVDGRSLAGA